ncbi:hypothetical protein HanXRQr2_Chr17g0817271 [Helianthus annuus]|uniref:Uncharacterized protein n=1 Tax=Helianthus annuus TaxID=4232 RepID=A0A9K3DL57_HELAN|nr:hypothetical protein HanXRQr2_Chr17g0817271 [Helianthus annuus]
MSMHNLKPVEYIGIEYGVYPLVYFSMFYIIDYKKLLYISITIDSLRQLSF